MNKKEEIIRINYHTLTMCCSCCEKTGLKLVENGFCHIDLDDNGICLKCYDELKKNNLAKKFRAEWLDNPRSPEIEIYE